MTNEYFIVDNNNISQTFILRCFSCAKEDCILALRTIGTDVDITDCTRCASGKMRLKKIQKGGYMVSCANANCGNDSKPWWVPKFVKSGIHWVLFLLLPACCYIIS